MEQELAILQSREVLKLVLTLSVPAGKKVIGCRWVYTNKFDAEGNIVKRKACFSQVVGEDFKETYAMVVCLELLRMSIAIAAQLRLAIWQVDFMSAYLSTILHNVHAGVSRAYREGGEGIPSPEDPVWLNARRMQLVAHSRQSIHRIGIHNIMSRQLHLVTDNKRQAHGH